MRKSEAGFAFGHLAEPVVSLALSLLLGGAFGATIGRLMAVPSRPFNYVLKRLPPATQARCGAAARRAPRPLGMSIRTRTALELLLSSQRHGGASSVTSSQIGGNT